MVTKTITHATKPVLKVSEDIDTEYNAVALSDNIDSNVENILQQQPTEQWQIRARGFSAIINAMVASETSYGTHKTLYLISLIGARESIRAITASLTNRYSYGIEIYHQTGNHKEIMNASIPTRNSRHNIGWRIMHAVQIPSSNKYVQVAYWKGIEWKYDHILYLNDTNSIDYPTFQQRGTFIMVVPHSRLGMEHEIFTRLLQERIPIPFSPEWGKDLWQARNVCHIEKLLTVGTLESYKIYFDTQNLVKWIVENGRNGKLSYPKDIK